MTTLKYPESVPEGAGDPIHLKAAGRNPATLTPHHSRTSKMLNYIILAFTPQIPAALLKLTEQVEKHFVLQDCS